MIPVKTAPSVGLNCPVCNASFRNAEICPRCGTSLLPLMRLAARAWALRELSRKQLEQGNLVEALQHADAASRIQQLNLFRPRR
jgi:predicted amidophosphoribosyltransferase